VGLLHTKEIANGYELSRCGASLISPTKILTAAHCVTIGDSIRYEKYNFAKLIRIELNLHPLIYLRVRPMSEFQALLGMHFWNDTTNDAQETRNIIKIKIHEGYYTDDSITVGFNNLTNYFCLIILNIFLRL
jgi:hypothetical protein